MKERILEISDETALKDQKEEWVPEWEWAELTSIDYDTVLDWIRDGKIETRGNNPRLIRLGERKSSFKVVGQIYSAGHDYKEINENPAEGLCRLKTDGVICHRKAKIRGLCYPCHTRLSQLKVLNQFALPRKKKQKDCVQNQENCKNKYL